MSATERREQILDVAAALVAAEGFGSVSIQAVARGAGVTRPIVYEHFGGLQGLLDALVAREMGRAKEQVADSRLEDLTRGEPAALMIDSLARFLAAVEAHPDTWRLVLTPVEGAPRALHGLIVRGRAEVLASISEAVGPGSLPGDLSADPELTAHILSAMADEYARMVLADPQRYPPGRLLAHARWWLAQMAR